VAPPHRPNVPTGVFGNHGLSSSLPLFSSLFHSLTTFLSRSSPSGAAAVTSAATADVVVRAAPELEVVQEEAPAEGAMIAVRMMAAPPPSRGARAPLSSAPRRATASRAVASEGMEVVLGDPPPPFMHRVTSL
jgi:hypothetical protein